MIWQGSAGFAGDFLKAGGDQAFDQAAGQGVGLGEEDATFGGFEGGVLTGELLDDPAGMRVKTEVAFDDGIACDDAALRPELAKSGHGTAEDFKVIGWEGTQGLQGGALIGGQGGRGRCRPRSFSRLHLKAFLDLVRRGDRVFP